MFSHRVDNILKVNMRRTPSCAHDEVVHVSDWLVRHYMLRGGKQQCCHLMVPKKASSACGSGLCAPVQHICNPASRHTSRDCCDHLHLPSACLICLVYIQHGMLYIRGFGLNNDLQGCTPVLLYDKLHMHTTPGQSKLHQPVDLSNRLSAGFGVSSVRIVPTVAWEFQGHCHHVWASSSCWPQA